MKNFIIGIDISSKTLDICVKESQELSHFEIENSQKAILKFFRVYKENQVIVAMENTGRYNWNLFEVLPKFNFKIYVLNPLHLSKSLGLVRGKDDKTDAYRICLFTEKNKEDLTLWKPTPKAIKKLKIFITERTSRIKMKRRLLKQQHDYKLMKDVGLDKELAKLNKQFIDQIVKQIKLIEQKIQTIINEDSILKQQAKLISSVPGVGKILTWTMIAKTEGFTKITDPRKMACYTGVVPFEYQSGTSVYRKPRVSMFADKPTKAVLHLGAMSAIRLNNDLRVYYLRKVNEGKNKMLVLNAVRNKIIHRIFAVIKNQEFYKNPLVLS
ncbi:IS110 family transposase [Lutibacter sp. HS1-25]|uniref:IS110 family transposase n=2 Tax=Lutibacter sp. HS1-25 TaxID=2485000 RepID=UPI001010F7DD|nr:IS110 family transposase [Lutibacter sp. HS1-25]RXP49661.1 IS110 family transposase [Lutibacter sp. HS1-25]RXP51953.1 IS110 family transposase [Lutibacter sp. HS1-25]RXP52568.1 IS110 family transposase [Lutibacter sp. HS1-25]RXP52733.1 IS110 family transposase [Lutibacter sp. HS1-25]